VVCCKPLRYFYMLLLSTITTKLCLLIQKNSLMTLPLSAVFVKLITFWYLVINYYCQWCNTVMRSAALFSITFVVISNILWQIENSYAHCWCLCDTGTRSIAHMWVKCTMVHFRDESFQAWLNKLRLNTRHNIGHFGDYVPNQSLGLYWYLQ